MTLQVLYMAVHERKMAEKVLQTEYTYCQRMYKYCGERERTREAREEHFDLFEGQGTRLVVGLLAILQPHDPVSLQIPSISLY